MRDGQNSCLCPPGAPPDGEEDVLGLWVEQTEGAKFWLKVINELKMRGVNDILIAVVDGLKGFPEAITSVYPQTVVQTCIVHLIRTAWPSCPGVARRFCRQSRRSIGPRRRHALVRLEEFEADGAALSGDRPGLRRAWEPWFRSSPSPPASAMIYTTTRSGVAPQPAQIIKTRGSFPNDDAALAALPRHQECRLAVAAKH